MRADPTTPPLASGPETGRAAAPERQPASSIAPPAITASVAAPADGGTGMETAELLPLDLLPGNAPPTGPATPATPHATVAKPDAPGFAAQIADMIVSRAGQKIEIALQPEELGRVRMAMTLTDAGATVVIAADRPETLDLMRRHIDALADAIRNLGYDSLTFDFRGGQSPQDNTPPPAHAPDDDTDPAAMALTQTTPQTPPTRVAASGLDMRL